MPEGGQIYHLNTCSSRHFEPLFLTGIIKRQLHQQRSEREVRKIAGGGGERKREREGEMHGKQWLYLELVVHGGIDKQFP